MSGKPPRRFAQFREAALRLRASRDRRAACMEVDALLHSGVLHEVDLEWNDHAERAVECLHRTISENDVGTRLDIFALCYHREVLEALRMALIRVVESVDQWPDAPEEEAALRARIDHAASLRARIDADVAYIDGRVRADVGDGRGLAALLTEDPWTPDEAALTPMLRDASARWRGWWLDWFPGHEEKIAAG